MLSAILGLFGSSGFGGLLGLIGGFANRYLDLQTKKLDYAQELALRDKDKELLVVEWEQRSKVAVIEAEAAIETAGYAALTESFGADKATYNNKWIDGIRGLVRPLLTFILAGAALLVNIVLLEKLVEVWDTVDTKAQITLATTTVEWVLFQASIAIGWWFAHRPSSKK